MTPVCLPGDKSSPKRGPTLKEKHLLRREQILFFMLRPQFIWEAKMKMTVAFPESVPIHLKYSYEHYNTKQQTSMSFEQLFMSVKVRNT